jgi:hypothetical protein
VDRHGRWCTWSERSGAQVDAMNDTYYTLAAYSINDTTTAATGETVIRQPFDPAAQQHNPVRALRSNFCPTGRRAVGKPDGNRPRPGRRNARLATGPSFLVGRRHRTRQRQHDCPATTKGRQGGKSPSLCLTRASKTIPYPLQNKMGGGGSSDGF